MRDSDPRYNPAPNLSPVSAGDRFFGLIVGIGVAIAGLAGVAALGAIWITLTLAVAAAVGAGLGGALALCTAVAMLGAGVAGLAALAWSVLQIGSVRRSLGMA